MSAEDIYSNTDRFDDFNDYQLAARETANMETKDAKARLANWALGISGEAGEIADIIKKHVYHGHDLPKEELIKEIGDVLWYLSILAYELDTWFGDIADLNIKKLYGRYPEGFSKERSINRIDG